MMKRRDFFRNVAALPAFAASAAVVDMSGVKSRQAAKWEIVYKTPHAKPNALDMSREGMWILDQGPDSWVSLVNFADGKVIREFKTAATAGSGLTVDEHGVMWIASPSVGLNVTVPSASCVTVPRCAGPVERTMSLSSAVPTLAVPGSSTKRPMMLSQPFGALRLLRRFAFQASSAAR